jgi:LuxR family maltose regulon positive regulatory protein
MKADMSMPSIGRSVGTRSPSPTSPARVGYQSRAATTNHGGCAVRAFPTAPEAALFAEVQKALTSEGETVDAPGTEPEPLTDRELQVLTLLQSDLSLRDIGSELFVSRNTAKSHVASVYRKLGVTSRTAAIARASQLDLI